MMQLKDLLVGYSNKPLIEIKELFIKPGEVVALIGKSGCGKSTLFATIAGHIEPLRGEVFLDGFSDIHYKKEKIAMTLQGFPLFHWLTVRQGLELAAKVKNAKRVDFNLILTQFSAEHIADAYPSQLSGGEKCRASLSQAVLKEPALLLLDEPLVGLDTITKNSIGENVFSFVQKHKMSAIMITHDIHDAITYTQKVIVLARNDNEQISNIVKIFNTDEKDVYDKIVSTLEQEYSE
jgi:ABC-type nitrate/sulfonate/bicarbonate transport system ATPase subunit